MPVGRRDSMPSAILVFSPLKIVPFMFTSTSPNPVAEPAMLWAVLEGLLAELLTNAPVEVRVVTKACCRSLFPAASETLSNGTVTETSILSVKPKATIPAYWLRLALTLFREAPNSLIVSPLVVTMGAPSW